MPAGTQRADDRLKRSHAVVMRIDEPPSAFAQSQRPSIDDSAKSGQLQDGVSACADLSLLGLISAIFLKLDRLCISADTSLCRRVPCQLPCQHLRAFRRPSIL